IEPCIEPVRIRLLACDLPGDLSLSVVHGPASQPVRPLAAPTPGGTRGGGARWSIMVDGPGCACHQVIDIQTAAREETAMRDPRDLYRFESTEVLEAVPRGGLTLVHALPGMVDAGGACRIASTYLRDELRHLPLVS